MRNPLEFNLRGKLSADSGAESRPNMQYIVQGYQKLYSPKIQYTISEFCTVDQGLVLPVCQTKLKYMRICSPPSIPDLWPISNCLLPQLAAGYLTSAGMTGVGNAAPVLLPRLLLFSPPSPTTTTKLAVWSAWCQKHLSRERNCEREKLPTSERWTSPGRLATNRGLFSFHSLWKTMILYDMIWSLISGLVIKTPHY